MSIRAILAAIVTIVVLFVGAVFLMRLQGAEFGDYLAALLYQKGDDALRCFLLAAGAALAAVFAVVSSFSAFRDIDEDEYETRFPYGAIPFFLIVSAGFFWFATGCGRTPIAGDAPRDEIAAPLVAEDAEQTAALSNDDDLLGAPTDEPVEIADADLIDVPVRVEEPATPAPTPAVVYLDTKTQWPYQYPLIRSNAAMVGERTEQFLDGLFPADAPAVRALLCGKAWVAVTGASSKEGPAIRNQIRARARAALAAREADLWIAAHGQDCEAPIVLAIDLGQHENGAGAGDSDHAATAYQREALFVSRDLAAGETPLLPDEALDEANAYLATPDSLSQLLGDRRYPRAPVVFLAPTH